MTTRPGWPWRPPAAKLGVVLSLAYAKKLLSPGLSVEGLEIATAQKEAKHLAKDGRLIKLLLEETDFCQVEEARAALGLGQNQFALLAIRSQLYNLDPMASMFMRDSAKQSSLLRICFTQRWPAGGSGADE